MADIVNSNIRLFADDTTVFFYVDNPNVSAKKLNDDLARMHQWATTWLVTFSPEKNKTYIHVWVSSIHCSEWNQCLQNWILWVLILP